MFDPTRAAALTRWIDTAALPLWTGIGIDPATGTAWEELDATGAPCPDMDRRLRVQVRQAYAFALPGPAQNLALARQLFDFAMTRGFDPETGHLAAMLAPDLHILTAPHDLYDMAFMLLAAAALIDAGEDIAADLARLEQSLDRLKTDRGWVEDATARLPRRQNPHMHHFEAMTALYTATGEARFLTHAETCLGLFRDVFLQPDGTVLEFFDADWTPLTDTAQSVEPGHMAEWIFLLDRFEAATGTASGVDLVPLFAATLAARDAMGLLPDVAGGTTRRMWPQTELLKASLVMRRRGHLPEGEEDLPERTLQALQEQYFSPSVPGGWIDKRASDGTLLSDAMPTSTFYHVIVAARFYASQRETS